MRKIIYFIIMLLSLEMTAQEIEKFKVPKDMEFFIATNGNALGTTRFGKMILKKNHNQTFFQEVLKSGECGGALGDDDYLEFGYFYGYYNVLDSTSGRISRQMDTLVVDGIHYLKTNSLKAGRYIKIKRSPDKRITEYCFTIKDSIKITVSYSEFDEFYGSYRVFFDQVELDVREFERYRDGGTTSILTREGYLYIPASRKGPPRWTTFKEDKTEVLKHCK